MSSRSIKTGRILGVKATENMLDEDFLLSELAQSIDLVLCL